MRLPAASGHLGLVHAPSRWRVDKRETILLRTYGFQVVNFVLFCAFLPVPREIRPSKCRSEVLVAGQAEPRLRLRSVGEVPLLYSFSQEAGGLTLTLASSTCVPEIGP